MGKLIALSTGQRFIRWIALSSLLTTETRYFYSHLFIYQFVFYHYILISFQGKFLRKDKLNSNFANKTKNNIYLDSKKKFLNEHFIQRSAA